jgi:hypothetical protein
MDECRPLLQRSYWILVSWGAQEGDVLGRTWGGRSGGDCLVNQFEETLSLEMFSSSI